MSPRLSAMRSAGALLLMLASGFAGMGYQIIWTRQSGLWLGHEAPAVLAVITAFFLGLALGALIPGRRSESAAQALRWYAGCELLMALWALCLSFGLRDYGDAVLGLMGLHPSALWAWTLVFLGSLLVLLPATAAMGATLPALQRLTQRPAPARGEQGRLQGGLQGGLQGSALAALYAANTLGATLGVLATAFWLLPALGLRHTAWLCALLNTGCALAALSVFRNSAALPPRVLRVRGARPLLLRLALSGLLGIGYEVLVVRVLSQVAEDTVYTYALLLAVYLVGSAAGAALYARWLLASSDVQRTERRLLSLLATIAVPSVLSLWQADRVQAGLINALGAGMPAALLAEAGIAVLAFGGPTLMMGLLFSHLSRQAGEAGVGYGAALAANTLGAAGAPLLFGVLAFPLLGPKWALVGLVLGYLLLIPVREWRRIAVAAPACAVLAIGLLAPPLAFIDVPEGGQVLSYRQGAMAAVSVVEDAQGVRRLRIDNRQQEGSNATQRVDGRQALLPVLLHPAPRRALFLGLGTGVTASTAAMDPRLQVQAVELLPEVIAARAYFVDENTAATQPSIIAADARRYVKLSREQYDVIVADNFHPARSGSGALYTVEHFAAVRARLGDGGLFCQWLPLHQLDLATLRSIVRAYLAVFPDAAAILASNSLETPVIGLMGRAGKTAFALTDARRRLADAQPAGVPQRYGIEDEYALLGSFIAGPYALRRFAADAPLNTDDDPIVTYLAPRATYAPQDTPSQRLLQLLDVLSVAHGEVFTEDASEDGLQRLSAYRAARSRYIALGRQVRVSRDVKQMLAQLGAPLLDILRQSPDFRPAYDPLLSMATQLAAESPQQGRMLLLALQAAQPERTEAGLALSRLDAAGH